MSILLIGSAFIARADHITGGEMYYTYAGIQGDQHLYQVTLRLLMRCNSGRNFPNPILIGVFDKANNSRVKDYSVPLGSQNIIQLNNTDPCISNPPPVCYDVATYYFDVIVPSNTQGYTITAQVNFRVNGLANLQTWASSIGATYTAEIPGAVSTSQAFVNSSAIFTGSDLVVVCSNSPFTYSFSAADRDKDTLRYTFCSAYQSGTSGGGMNNQPPIPPPYSLVPYGEGFGGTIPLGNRVIVNPLTGLVSGIAPPVPGIYVITVCVDEIRNGVVIATQRKDIQLNITGCTVAAALLAPTYQLCNEADEIAIENLSNSPLIQAYAWKLIDRQGNTVTTSSNPRFTHRFSDTGLYKISLHTNSGLSCPDNTSADIRVYPGMRVGFGFAGQCFGSPSRFTDNSTTVYGSFQSRSWNLGEVINPQNQSQLLNPSIIYQSQGNKTAFLKVVNSNGCVDSTTRVLSISAEPPIQFALRDTLICPPDTLQLQVFGDGAFTWDMAPGLLSGGNTATPMVAPLSTTWYRVTQRLDNCVGRDSIRVQVVNAVQLNAMADTTICLGDSLRLRLSGNALKYTWTPSATLSNPGQIQPMARPIATTRYTVMGQISQCKAEKEIFVTAVPYPTANAGTDQAVCFGNAAQLNSTHDGVRLLWTPSSNLSDPTIQNPIANPVQTTSYLLQVFDSKGCPKPGIDTVIVKVEPPINLAVTTDTSAVVGQALQFNATGASKYLWTPSTGFNRTDVANPVFTFNQPSDGLTYLLLGYNDAGCRDSLLVRIRVFANGPSIYVPTAFTPNGDGLNESLYPTLAGMQRLEYFRVFNRYGEMVYSTTSPYDTWDGTLRGQRQPSGNYIWIVQAIDFEGKVVQAKGSAVLLR